MFAKFDSATATDGYKFLQKTPWVESLGISYHVGVDGINVGLILMGAIVAFAAALCSFEIQSREKEFYILLLTMSGGILAAFASLDLFFFYFLHELALVPTFIMIGVWGRGEKKNYATFQITLYLSIGALMIGKPCAAAGGTSKPGMSSSGSIASGSSSSKIDSGSGAARTEELASEVSVSAMADARESVMASIKGLSA